MLKLLAALKSWRRLGQKTRCSLVVACSCPPSQVPAMALMLMLAASEAPPLLPQAGLGRNMHVTVMVNEDMSCYLHFHAPEDEHINYATLPCNSCDHIFLAEKDLAAGSAVFDIMGDDGGTGVDAEHLELLRQFLFPWFKLC